jgi:antitoxin component of RelBE/YafQ-DinJ toxin-antitoxin module
MDTIFVKVNGELAARAKSIFSRYGVDMETALNMYLMQVISNVGAPSLRQENNRIGKTDSFLSNIANYGY